MYINMSERLKNSISTKRHTNYLNTLLKKVCECKLKLLGATITK